MSAAIFQIVLEAEKDMGLVLTMIAFASEAIISLLQIILLKRRVGVQAYY